VTRDEAASLLSHKDVGNFIVRSSRLQDTLALSVKTAGEVQHFIILRKGDGVLLEDSELQFDSLLSLIFHYSNICDELPCLLYLPAILATTESIPHLESLSLLAKDFWNYPMSKPGRRSLLISDFHGDLVTSSDLRRNSITSSNALLSSVPQSDGDGSESDVRNSIPERSYTRSDSDTSEISTRDLRNSSDISELSARLNSQLEQLERKTIEPFKSPRPVTTTTPPRPPRRSCGRLDTPTSSPLATPPSRQRRRVSDSSCPSMMDSSWTKQTPVTKEPSGWVSSPLFTGKPRAGSGRKRKESVFMDRLSVVQESVKEMNSLLNGEEDTKMLTELIQSASRRQSTEPSSLERETLSRRKPVKEERVTEHLYTECVQKVEETQEDGDYAEPMDRVDSEEANVYSEPKQEDGNEILEEKVKNIWENKEKGERLSLRKQRFSDSNIRYGENEEISERGDRGQRRHKRKLSLGVMLRRMSQLQIPGGERKPSRTEARLSCVIGRMMAGPKRLGGSHQVDSSSWEFLNKDDKEDSSSSSVSAGSSDTKTTSGQLEDSEEGKGNVLERGHTLESCGDSVYESEYFSSSNSSLTRQSDSAFSSLNPDNSFNDQVVLPRINLQRWNEELSIRSYVRKLAKKNDSLFGRSARQFTACTLSSDVHDPLVVLRNMRQFMTGMKNYLVKWGEGELHNIIQEERTKLRSDEFLDIDLVLEEEMQSVVVQPLAAHLELLFRQDYSSSGIDVRTKAGIESCQKEGAIGMGVPTIYMDTLPDVLQACRPAYCKLLCSSCPRDKFKLYLNIVSSILTGVTGSQDPHLSVETFTSILSYVLVQLGAEQAEMESELLWGILSPSLLSGEGGYYLTLLSAAVHSIRSRSQDQIPPSCLTVLVPSHLSGSLVQRSVPLRPGMTVRDVSRIIAAKMQLQDPEQFCLYRLMGGEESRLAECLPISQVSGAQVEKEGRKTSFIYRKHEASLLLPIR